GPEDIPSVKAILNTLLPLEILLPVAENNKSKTINNDHPQKSCGAQPTTDEKY
ncbi:TPA: conjugal transfer protein TrbC, partial [Escherichia coli]